MVLVVVVVEEEEEVCRRGGVVEVVDDDGGGGEVRVAATEKREGRPRRLVGLNFVWFGKKSFFFFCELFISFSSPPSAGAGRVADTE